MINQTISHYKILEKLGEGGMGVVYKAEDTKLKRTVALKFLPPDLTRDSEAKERFIHEAQAASALDHPNICNIHEIDETAEGQMFICMACYEGQTVKEKIQRGPLKVEEAVDIAMQVAQGLAKAHGQGIVHRDIKPGNLFVTEDGRVKILDFGLAKLAGQMRLTKTSTTMGTVAYMSPEQTRGEDVDQQTDIWSLGVVLYEMLTGQLPFKGDYEQAIVYSILNEEPRSINELKKGVPETLQVIVKKAVEKDSARRYKSTSQMLEHIEAMRVGLAVREEPHFERKRRRRTARTMVISAAMVLAVILTIVLVRHKQERVPGRIPIGRIPIGVMFFDNQTSENKYDYLRKVLADMLITDLSESKYLQVLTFPRMFEIQRSLGYEDMERIDAPVGFELCKLGGAHVMVVGSLMKSGETFVINAQVLDVDTKKQIDAYRVTGKSEDSILGHLVDDLTDKIKKGLEISLKEIRQEEKDITALTTTSLEAYKYYFTGREAAFRMYNQEAIDKLEKAVLLDSTFIEAYDALARQYYFIGENTKALQIIEKVKSFSGKLAEGKLIEILSLEALLKEDWDLAINYLKRLIRLNPDNIKAHNDLGMVYYQRKMMYDEGIAEFQKVLELDPQGVTHRASFTYNVLGYAYLRKGDREKALGAFKKYVALLPNQAYPLDCLGEFYCSIGDYDRAIENLQRALELKPDFPLTYVNLGHTYSAKGMYTRARRSYERYLASPLSEAKQAEGHFYLGNLHFLKGEYDQALQECQRALELNSQMIEPHWIQGLAFVKQEVCPKAESKALAIKALVENSKSEELNKYYYHLLGELSLSKGLSQQALENFAKAANIMSLDRTFYVNALGEAYLKIGELKSAVEEFEVVLALNPNYAPSHYLLGQVYERDGMKKEARHHFQKLMEILKDADEDLPQLIEAKRRMQEL
jgi:serine/threonine protein kinase/tetratricopeptide (TPR) repeat protein